jgi:hypothetical protein
MRSTRTTTRCPSITSGTASVWHRWWAHYRLRVHVVQVYFTYCGNESTSGRIWGPPGLLSNRYRGLFLRG